MVAAFVRMRAGALCCWGKVEFAAALAVATTVLLATTVMFVRVVAEVAARNRALLGVVWVPLAAATVGVAFLP